MRLLFGIHCHQPYNNFFEVIHEAVDLAYLPFLKVLSNYPDIKISIHFSGWLFEWIKEHREDLFSLIKVLSDRGQIEFFTSGFYEPILVAIPEEDAELQIEKSNKFIRDNFGVSPKGLWLTERVWDFKVVKVALRCGIEYVVVDDYHFISAGLREDELQGYFLTEDEGNCLGVFPISKKLRYLIPFRPVEECIEFLKGMKAGIIFDDGEKFGLWPQTFKWVYEKRWLDEFFEKLLSEGIKTSTFMEFFENNKPLGRAYPFPTSYFEMGQWALSYESSRDYERYYRVLKEDFSLREDVIERFFKGGMWLNFLSKYEESNNIHKKMIKVSKRIKNKSLKDEATEWLLKSQFNDCLWHGIFGGIYLPNLRNNAFIALNRAEKFIEFRGRKFHDYNCDGYGELEIRNDRLIAVISERWGAQLFELSMLDTGFNILNTLTRRREVYHDEILNFAGESSYKESADGIDTIHEMEYEITPEVRESLKFDTHLRYAFVDIFFSKYETFESYINSSLENLGDFLKPFKFVSDKSRFEREGFISIYTERFPVRVCKSYSVRRDVLTCRYMIKNLSSVAFDINHGVEINLFLPGSESEKSFLKVGDKKIGVLESFSENKGVDKIEIYDSVLERWILISSKDRFKVWSYPFFSVSRSERAYEKTYQGSAFLLIFPFSPKPSEEIFRKIDIKVGVR